LKTVKELYRSDKCPGLKKPDGGKRYVKSGIPMTYFFVRGAMGRKAEGRRAEGRRAERPRG